ncbi:hypothetical protein NKJ40_09065, partial [Mesorhizobium sp. M0119]|uniref:hypothetical protein n=1 Tax=Mesorhizobium sp. M0119 TaxID=2956885 RepID=UPI003338659D
PMLASTPASILNHKTDKSGIPFDSVKGGTALATSKDRGSILSQIAPVWTALERQSDEGSHLRRANSNSHIKNGRMAATRRSQASRSFTICAA